MVGRKVTVITDADGRKTVRINDILFKGRKIDWKLVRDYLKMFVGDCYEVEQSSEKIYIGGKLPDDYTGSESRIALKKAEAKANWEEAKMSPSQRQAKMQEERDAQIAAANERKAAADARIDATRKKQ